MSETLIGAPGSGPASGTSSGGELIIELRDVFCVHRTREGDAAALQGLSLRVGRGEQLCVLGPSGAGKTTLLRVIAGLDAPSAGIVQVLGRDIGRVGARARAALRHETIGFPRPPHQAAYRRAMAAASILSSRCAPIAYLRRCRSDGGNP